MSRGAGIRTRWRFSLVLRRRGLLVVLHLLHASHFLVVNGGRRSFIPQVTVRDLAGVYQRNILRILVVRVRQVLVVVAGVRQVGEVADGRMLVYLVAGRLTRGGLGRNLVRRWRTRGQGPAVDGGTHYGGGGLGLDGRPAGVRRGTR